MIYFIGHVRWEKLRGSENVFGIMICFKITHLYKKFADETQEG